MEKRDPNSVSPPLHERPVLICFSHLRWNFVYQRPQHLLSRASRDYRVIFFEEPVHENVDEPWLDLHPQSDSLLVAVPVLPEGMDEHAGGEAQRRMLDGLLADRGASSLLFWYYTPMALAFSDHVTPDLCIYDCMDELSAFRGAPPPLLAFERCLFDRADLVFTGGQSLFEAKRNRHPNVHAFPSSIDADHFRRARALGITDPEDQRDLARPRVGFFGVIDERMDTGLVARVATLRPDWQFVMIGPVAKIDAAELPRRPNIHWLGGKTYAELPAYLAGWDLGLMPFALNEATRFISPTKTPEYLAAGVPVVSTPITDVIRPYGQSGLVEIATSPEEIVASAERLLRTPKAGWLERVDRHLAGMSWNRTWAVMQALIRSTQTSRRESAVPVANRGGLRV